MTLYLLLLVATANVASAYYRGSYAYNGYEYAYFSGGEDNVNWFAAQSACVSQWNSVGSEFAMAKSSEINNAIGVLLAPYGYLTTWLGGNDIHAERTWIWIDGTSITYGYNNWNKATNEPNNNGGEDCLQVNYQAPKVWNDEQCEQAYGYVCQIATNRVVSSDFSELTICDQTKSAKTLWEAKRECKRIGARLVKITDDRSKRAILRKLEGAESAQYWIDTGVESQCSVLNHDGSGERDCDARFGFLCETARPNMLEVSNENPVVTESGDLQVECTASGYPLPDVAWYRGDEFVTAQSVGMASSTLVIKNASTADAGQYICVATNTIDGTLYRMMGGSDAAVISEGD